MKRTGSLLFFCCLLFACNNKKDKKDPAPTEDTVVQKPVDGGNLTTPDGKMGGDTVAQKPVDGGN